ncbi:MAG: UMUC-like DNA-repair protein [Rhodobacteraceae bacterium]|nr:UMUC-like DNA-repair protein [Paracoccaceae bacterium]
MTPMRFMYIDMNSFFASVEQQMDPALRGRPVGITAMASEFGVCVAASYEAKAYGVTTGTRVYKARKQCPDIVFRPSRHRLYVRVNQKIAEVIDTIAELDRVRSVDEFQVALGGRTSDLGAAMLLACRIKTAIRENVGSELRCSIGIGANHLLAKIASKLHKPDGLAWLAPTNMPDRIAHLPLDDLPGISRGTLTKLYRSGIWSIPDLYNLDPGHARRIWRSVEGERFVLALRGMDIRLEGTQRHGYGNSKVLSPKYRHHSAARLVGRWLVEKAAERMRRDGYCAGLFMLNTTFAERRRWSGKCPVAATQDTRQILDSYESLWKRMVATGPSQLLSVSIRLGKLIPVNERPGDWLLPCAAGHPTVHEKLAAAIDRLNYRYRERVVSYGVHQPHPGFFERG